MSAHETEIVKVVGRRVWDSRGRPTVEAEVYTAGGVSGRAIVPAGASMGTGEAVDLRDGGAGFGAFEVKRAVANVNGEIAARLRGFDVNEQGILDQALIDLDGTPNKARLGGNSLIAVSMAAAHAAAANARQPLYRYWGGQDANELPLPEIQIFGGGAHASQRVDIQDFMVIPLNASNFDASLTTVAKVYYAAGRLMAERGKLQGLADEGGFWPAFDTNEEALETLVRAIEAAGFIPAKDVGISLDIAASQFYRSKRYRLGLENKELDSDGMCDLIRNWLDRFPIVAIEDPLAEDDLTGLHRLTASEGHRVEIVGDDFLVTHATRIAAAGRERYCNAVLIKPNQAGTLTETKAALDAARKMGFRTILSARSGETEDTTLTHLAIGWKTGQIKVGSFARSERMAKWNEALRIEEILGPKARFAGRAVLRI